MNGQAPNHPDPADPLYFVRLGEQSIREKQQRRAAARYDPDDAHFSEANDFEEVDPRHDGWTPHRQRDFLTALARGFSVSNACNVVGMSRQSAYALRESARGATFALGWNAALLRARDVLADELMDRALNGVRETVTNADGEVTVTRHRQDNGLAWRMLNRLDKRADAACTDTGAAAARLAAADFEQLLDLIGHNAAPARAGLFLAARIERAGAEAAGEDELAPIRTLARADRWLRTHADVATPLDTADLDPARRADWTAAQWARAEAAGLVQLAPPPAEPAAADTGEMCQLRQPDPIHPIDDSDVEPVWWDEMDACWKTDFPPPDDFLGEQHGSYGSEDYWRRLDDAEVTAVTTALQAEVDATLPAAIAEREAWFAQCLADAEAVRAAAASTIEPTAPEPQCPPERKPAPATPAAAPMEPPAMPPVPRRKPPATDQKP